MKVNYDYEDIFRILNEGKVRYLVVGAYTAMNYIGPRATRDIDIWIKPEKANAKRIYDSLKKFGAPLIGIKVSDFIRKDTIYQIGVAPIRIDILMDVGGIDFDLSWKHRKKVKYGNEQINILNKDDVIKSKMKAGRKQDVLDLEKLLKVKKVK